MPDGNPWALARADLETTSSTLEEARSYVARWPKYPPDFFLYGSSKQRAAVRRAFGEGDGWASRLALTLAHPALFTLHAAHLGLSEEDGNPRRLYDLPTLARWKQALKTHFSGPCYIKLEAASRLHVHVIADLHDGPPDLPRGGEVIKELYDLEGCIGYLTKPPLPYTAEGLSIFLEGRRRLGRLPRASWTLNLPRTVKANPSYLRNSNPSSSKTDISTPPIKSPSAAPSAPLRRPALTRPRMSGKRRRRASQSASAHASPSVRPLKGSSDPMRQRRARGPPSRPRTFTDSTAQIHRTKGAT